MTNKSRLGRLGASMLGGNPTPRDGKVEVR
jgi:hypothetical protein